MRSSVLNFLKSAFFQSVSLKTRIWLVLLEWAEHSLQNSCVFYITSSSLLAESSLYNQFPLSPVPFKWWNFQSSHLGIYLISCFSKKLETFRLLLHVHFKSQHLSLCFISVLVFKICLQQYLPFNLITTCLWHFSPQWVGSVSSPLKHSSLVTTAERMLCNFQG